MKSNAACEVTDGRGAVVYRRSLGWSFRPSSTAPGCSDFVHREIHESSRVSILGSLSREEVVSVMRMGIQLNCLILRRDRSMAAFAWM